MSDVKLYMLYLGCKPGGRHVEQHDVFFGIGASLKELVPQIKSFWPDSGDKIHIDAWREVTSVDGYEVKIVDRVNSDKAANDGRKLFFINLGGYQEHIFSEQHYLLLNVKGDRAAAMNAAKETLFFKLNQFAGAVSHIDDKYGIDVDDINEIEDILSPREKQLYQIQINPAEGLRQEEVQIGYLKLSTLQ